ncbi:MAG: hypothetical protein L0Y32_02145 [Nevskiales bacterium]|nr:hypothetical protein [Nevskiales bacterium]
MKVLQILNAVLLAFGTAMGLVLGVVCLIYGVYLEAEPRLKSQLPDLLMFTAGFSALALLAGAAFLGHRRRWPLRWCVQGLPVLPLLGLALFVIRLSA